MFFEKFIFNFLELITHKIQRFCGLDNFWLAKMVTILTAVSYFDTFVNLTPVAGKQTVIPLEEQKILILMLKIVCIPQSFILAVVAMVSVGNISKRVYRDQMKGLSNYLKVDFNMKSARFSLWLCLLGGAYIFFKELIEHPKWVWQDIRNSPLAIFGVFCMFLWLYLVGCDPLPYSPSWIKDKWNSLFSKRCLVFVQS